MNKYIICLAVWILALFWALQTLSQRVVVNLVPDNSPFVSSHQVLKALDYTFDDVFKLDKKKQERAVLVAKAIDIALDAANVRDPRLRLEKRTARYLFTNKCRRDRQYFCVITIRVNVLWLLSVRWNEDPERNFLEGVSQGIGLDYVNASLPSDIPRLVLSLRDQSVKGHYIGNLAGLGLGRLILIMSLGLFGIALIGRALLRARSEGKH